MSCTCNEGASSSSSAGHVADFTVTGFGPAGAAARHPQLEGVLALKAQFCVSASTAPNNQICFSAPIVGQYCITSPVPIPPGAQLKACGETCGSWIPTGVKVSIYLNGNVIWTGTVWGSC
jgi:hypothetical protein